MTDCGAKQVAPGDLWGFSLRMFAKAAAKHPKKYPCFNKFSLLCIDDLNSFDSDISSSVPVSIPVSADSPSSLSSIPYKTSNGSTVYTSRARKDSVLTRRAAQKPALVAPISVSGFNPHIAQGGFNSIFTYHI